MYLEHYGFKEDPFGVCPNPRFFFNSVHHAEAVATLYYAMTLRRGFAAFIAPPGLGKTTVLVSLLNRLRKEAEVALIVHPSLSGDAILESVLAAFGLEPNQRMGPFLQKLHAANRTAVVILDEAQNLGRDALETLRMLSNFETTETKLIQFIMAGQPGLAKLLGSPECEQIRQRVNLVARLKPLTTSEVSDYISHRVQVAGATTNPFTREAARAIARVSEGVPRNINTICFNALTLGLALNKKKINTPEIEEVTADLDITRAGIPSCHHAEETNNQVAQDSRPAKTKQKRHWFTRPLITLGLSGAPAR